MSRTDDILAGLPEADRAKAIQHLARADLALERQRLLTLLGPHIRQWIREEINNPTKDING